MRKYQQGGVSVFDPIRVNTPDVGSINPSPIINLPEVPEINLPAMANMAQSSEQRRRQVESDAKAQESRLASTQKEFYELTDQLFGQVHNPYQMEVLNKVKKKYGIDDDFYANMNTSDYFQLKSETDKLYKAVHDPEALAVIGEVEAANKYMERPAPLNLTEEELADAEAYRAGYMTANDKSYDVTLLDKNRYKRPAVKTPPQPKDLAGVTHRTATGYSRAVDWDNQEEVDQYANMVAMNWYATSRQTAEDLGFIDYDAAGNPFPTELGKKYAVEQGMFASDAYFGKRQDKIDDATTMAQTRDALADGNRAAKEASKKSGAKTSPIKGVTPEKYDAAWGAFTSEFPEFANIVDPYDPEVAAVFGAIVNGQGELTTTSKSRADVANRLKELYKDTPEAAIIEAQRRGADTARRLGQLNPNAPAAVAPPAATTPAQTNPAPGTKPATPGRTAEDL